MRKINHHIRDFLLCFVSRKDMVINMNNDYKKIIEQLNELGIKKGDKLLVHSSYKSLGKVEGGVMTVINALKDAVGEEGTLMLPTFTYDYVHKNNPVFDVRYTASNVGYITETFRHTEGVKRSLHPTHSLAVWGKDKEYYVENHHLDKACVGENSPIYKLKNSGGKILMLGCGLYNNTILHGIEVFYKPPYSMAVDYSKPEFHREYSCIDENDNIYRSEFFHVFAQEKGYEGDFIKLKNVCPMKRGFVLEAECFLMDAQTVWNTAREKIKQDPYYFVRPI